MKKILLKNNVLKIYIWNNKHGFKNKIFIYIFEGGNQEKLLIANYFISFNTLTIHNKSSSICQEITSS